MIRPTFIRRWLTFAAVEALIAFGWLLTIPTDPKNAWLFGFSKSRLVLSAGLLLGFLLLGGLSWLAWKTPAWGTRQAKRLEVLTRREFLFFQGGLFLVGLAFFLALHFILNGYLTNDDTVRPTLLRLMPYAVWGFLLTGHTLLTVRFEPGLWQAYTASAAWGRGKIWFAALLVFAAAWFPRAYQLDQFVTVDEPEWASSAANFLYALQNRDFLHTYRHEHPAVTVMWLGAVGILEKYPAYTQTVDDFIGPGQYENLLLRKNLPKVTWLAAGRTWMVFTNAFLLVVIFLFAQRLFGPGPALLGALLAALDPFHIAHTRLITLDGLLGSLMTLSIFAFLSYQQTARRVDLLISGVAAGLSWLTKTPGFFLIPAVGLLAILLGLPPRGERPSFFKKTLRLSGTLSLWGGVALFVFVALFPAMWVDPFGTLTKMFSETIGYAVEGHRGAIFFAGQVVTDGRLGGLGFYPTTFLWRTTPVILGGLGLLAFFLRGMDKDRRHAVLGVVIFVGCFFILQSLGEKKFDRYFLPVYVGLDILAGVGLAAWGEKWGPRFWWGAVRVGFGTLIIQLILVLPTFPYYLSYYNPLLGGATKAPEVMMIGWGEGLDQAARYLNTKPAPEKLSVISWYTQGSFSYFFHGDSEHFPITEEPDPARLQEILQMDYAVIYLQQWQRQVPQNLLDTLATRTPEYTVWINGIEYVRVYKLGE
ncbi:MAG: glycosyltransferase family 39 protein [Anaerolineales bacterium]|nr:glycosyltransferase family 39 protein [Anaerolineales bacterium]